MTCFPANVLILQKLRRVCLLNMAGVQTRSGLRATVIAAFWWFLHIGVRTTHFLSFTLIPIDGPVFSHGTVNFVSLAPMWPKALSTWDALARTWRICQARRVRKRDSPLRGLIRCAQWKRLIGHR